MPTRSTLAHYNLLERIGAGGMGEVWRARDTKLERDVAIKILPEHFADDAQRLGRFEREAKALASVNHPHVAQIHEVGQAEDTCYLVLELVSGGSLAQRLIEGPLTIERALEVGAAIAAGLEAAHEAGIVHRDLKPANVCLDDEGNVKVLDFGLAKSRAGESASGSNTPHETDSFELTSEGVVMGTPTYMSPEQARGRKVDRRTDVWAFGCVLYECLTGQRCFGGESTTDTLASILHDEPDWAALPANTPPRIVELLQRCLDKQPKQRLRDIGEARITLARAGGGSDSALGTTTTTSTTLAAVGAGATSTPARSSWPRALLLLVLVLGIAAGWTVATNLADTSGDPSTAGTAVGGDAASPAPPPTAVRVRPITFSGADDWPAVSPDGRTLAFASNRDGLSRLYVKRFSGGGAAVPVTAGPDTRPQFSADGASLLYVHTGDEPYSVYRVPVMGGAPCKLIHDAVEVAPSADGTRVAFLRPSGDASGFKTSLWVARADGSAPKMLHESRGRALSGPAWAPDGRRIVVAEGPPVN